MALPPSQVLLPACRRNMADEHQDTSPASPNVELGENQDVGPQTLVLAPEGAKQATPGAGAPSEKSPRSEQGEGAEAKEPPNKKRARKPSIDLDAYIVEATQAMKMAQKKVQEAKAKAKNERRKKQRLLKKAASLKAEDLERIAVLKRCGFVRADGTITEDVAAAAQRGAVAGSTGKDCIEAASASASSKGKSDANID